MSISPVSASLSVLTSFPCLCQSLPLLMFLWLFLCVDQWVTMLVSASSTIPTSVYMCLFEFSAFLCLSLSVNLLLYIGMWLRPLYLRPSVHGRFSFNVPLCLVCISFRLPICGSTLCVLKREREREREGEGEGEANNPNSNSIANVRSYFSWLSDRQIWFMATGCWTEQFLK